jgi:hypothetical protein
MKIPENENLNLFILGGIRTGHHYIIETIAKNMNYNTQIANDNGDAFKKNFAISSKRKGFLNDICLFDRENPNCDTINIINNLKIKNKLKILVMRDPFNNWASIKKNDKISMTFKEWEINYCNSIFLAENNLIDLLICYDLFISNDSYRNDILYQLGVNNEEYKDVLNVTKDGWGSSFSGYKLDNINELLTRKNSLNEEEIVKIENNKIINCFYEKYFT